MRAVAEEADERRMLAAHDLHDAALGASIGAAADDAAEDAVAVHRVAEAIAADEEIAVDAGDRMVGHEEGVAVAMRDDAACDEIRVAGAARLWCGRRRIGCGLFFFLAPAGLAGHARARRKGRQRLGLHFCLGVYSGRRSFLRFRRSS